MLITACLLTLAYQTVCGSDLLLLTGTYMCKASGKMRSLLLSPTQPQTLHVSGAHNSPVTCLEWSPDGELLYSGDVLGKVYVTVIKFREVFNIEFTGHFTALCALDYVQEGKTQLVYM